MRQYDDHDRISFFRMICKRQIKLLVGAIVYIRLLMRKEDTHYLMMGHALGDSVYAFSYLREYRKQHGYKHVTIVCSKSVERICSFWKDTFEDIICIDPRVIRGLQEVPRTIWGQQLYSFAHRDRITFVPPRCNTILRSYWNKVYSMNQFIRDFVFQIASDSEIQYPRIPHEDIQSIIEKYNITKNKSVLLNPYANSVRCDIFGLFEKIAEILKKDGFRVFTLTSSERELGIKGTQSLQCDLVEAYWLAEYCGTIIALRSGFLDLMVFAHCKIISIVDKDYGAKDFFQLEKWEVNPDCFTIEYENNDQVVIQQIADIMHMNVEGYKGCI